MTFRTGSGVDIHRLKAGIPLIIGGIEIQFHKGALGHSDGDVLIHAICDSILGALNLGDIGKYFPSDNASIKGINSTVILKKIDELIKKKNASIINIDSTIILQEPVLKDYIEPMKKVVCTILNIKNEQLSIKSKTTDHMGMIGSSDAIGAICTVLVEI